ncbi:hypothetical protein [Dictyobacter kobayashii]|uniref:hypothetical protein n=1 Tax=Dictyobacter kobayashii TaxID=2014872 RepID=UPI001386ABF4|nr:hypothetical protein [Dictyobacter kobayashii]
MDTRGIQQIIHQPGLDGGLAMCIGQRLLYRSDNLVIALLLLKSGWIGFVTP